MGYLTAANPAAAPGRLAVVLRVSIILALTGASLYAETSKLQRRMGRLLAGTALFSSLWLLNGSSARLPFSVGVLFSGAAPLVLSYAMLAHPSGRISSRTERRFFAPMAGAVIALWAAGVLMSAQPPLATPLLRCAPHCPTNVFALGSGAATGPVLKGALVAAWLLVSLTTAVLVVARRARSAAEPTRRALDAVSLAAVVTAVLLCARMTFEAAGSSAATTLSNMYVGTALVVPLAVLFGLVRERMSLGQVLAQLVSRMASTSDEDPEILIGSAFGDRTLRIAYLGSRADDVAARRPADGGARAVCWVEREGRKLAAVTYDAELRDVEPYLQAATAAALMRVEQAALAAELSASTRALEQSRLRLLEAAHAERRRIERDLHDSVQQQIVALRIKLGQAAEVMHDDPQEGERLLASAGRETDDVLQSLRSLARGIYPALLHDRGLAEALRSAALSAPVPVSVRARHIGRYHEDVEVAVYFCCLEALQNIAKHGGPDVSARVTLSAEGPRLSFGVYDDGPGFDSANSVCGSGLVNMRDRIEAVGGTVSVTSRKGHGTSVRGTIRVE